MTLLTDTDRDQRAEPHQCDRLRIENGRSAARVGKLRVVDGDAAQHVGVLQGRVTLLHTGDQ